MKPTQKVIASELIGKKGYPRYYAALGIRPPMKIVPILEDGQPDHNHPGLDIKDNNGEADES